MEHVAHIYKISARKPEGKRLLSRLILRWDIIIKMDFERRRV
jgi:hypothetical protein